MLGLIALFKVLVQSVVLIHFLLGRKEGELLLHRVYLPHWVVLLLILRGRCMLQVPQVVVLLLLLVVVG